MYYSPNTVNEKAREAVVALRAQRAFSSAEELADILGVEVLRVSSYTEGDYAHRLLICAYELDGRSPARMLIPSSVSDEGLPLWIAHGLGHHLWACRFPHTYTFSIRTYQGETRNAHKEILESFARAFASELLSALSDSPLPTA